MIVIDYIVISCIAGLTFLLTHDRQALFNLIVTFSLRPGHIYCITECGGAMEEGRCPECGSSIGGHDHRLRHDNQLASEMDGARYAAFSDLANIHNFEPRDFQ